MKYLETRTVAEYQLDNGLIACIRTLDLPDSIRVDLSVFERKIDMPELLMYSNLKQGKENIDGMTDILTILSDEDRCMETWKNYVSLNKKTED